MGRQEEPWGGDVHLPRWMNRLRRKAATEDTPERAHERHQPQDPNATVAENADRAAVGSLSALYREGRR